MEEKGRKRASKFKGAAAAEFLLESQSITPKIGTVGLRGKRILGRRKERLNS